jgi:hypothetical protein
MADALQSTMVLYDEDENADEVKALQQMQDAMALTVAGLNQLATDAVTARKVTEERWKAGLRQYHGSYDAKTYGLLKTEEQSRIFINITRPKTNAWAARLSDMLFPNDERNWGIDATPVPTLTGKQREMAKHADELERQALGLVEQHNAEVELAEQVGQPGADGALLAEAQEIVALVGQLRDGARQQQREIEFARKASKAMERLIDDQLTESNFPGVCRGAILDMCKVGVGIIKGPVVNDRPARRWQQMVDEAGQPVENTFELIADEAVSPRFRRVDYWHFFPDPSAQSMEDCAYTFERHLPNKKMLRRMAKDMGFYKPAVARLLKMGPRIASAAGNSDLAFMQELRALEADSEQTDSTDPLAERYLLWEYHGPLEAEEVATMLRIMGDTEAAARIEKAVALEVPMVRVIFCGSEVLKVDPEYVLDSGASLYSIATFEHGEGYVLGGVGVPHLMRNEQSMLNSAVRMMMDNGALSVAPQVVVDKEKVTPENGSWKLTPRKVWNWVRGNVPQPADNVPPFATFTIPINQQQLSEIILLALRFVDEAVSMPLIAQGEMGAHVTETAKGMSMLFNSANVGFRRVVKNWDDDVTTGLIRRAYDFNMQFSAREDVKGDMRVEARGTSVLLVRELQAEQLMGIIREWAAHPLLGVGFRAYHSMRLVLQAMSINPDDLLLAEEDYLQKLKQMNENQAQDPESVRAQSAIEIAQIEAGSRQAVADTNLEAVRIRAQTAFAELATRENISVTQIEAMFRTAQMRAATDLEKTAASDRSRERALATEIAVEDENKREAMAAGMVPTGSGGAVSAGMEPRR